MCFAWLSEWLLPSAKEQAAIDRENVDIDQTIRLREQAALQQEQAHVQDAVLRGKTEARNSDGVTLVRLTFHSELIRRHLLSSEDLEWHIARVRAAGCEVSP